MARTGWPIAGALLGVAVLAGCTTSSPDTAISSHGAAASSHGASASSPATAPAGTGSVAGTLHLAGGPAPGADQAAAGEVYVFSSANLTTAPTAQAVAGPDGTFHVTLPAGTYYLAATSPNFVLDPAPAVPPCHANSPAVVTAGSVTPVRITCPMK
jgi:hypothetical protein